MVPTLVGVVGVGDMYVGNSMVAVVVSVCDVRGVVVVGVGGVGAWCGVVYVDDVIVVVVFG